MAQEQSENKDFSHLDTQHNPSMVDVSGKTITKRTATARSIIALTPEIVAQFVNGDIQTKKGAVFQTAIIAGTMGAKRLQI
jgi:cyclic pyranopterin phosphate synthase